MLAGLFALVLAAALPQVAAAVPEPGAKRSRGFRLFAGALGALTINRVYCGLTSDGQVCVDSTNSSTIGGGFWPKGTANQYVFNSGLQVAGIVGPDGGPWAGDTTGAFFFDPKGTTQNGDEAAPIHNTTNAADAAFITAGADPMALAARVPTGVAAGGDATGELFDPLLQGRTSASQGDVWWLSWDGNPSLNAGRPHPLGILVEQRGMGWNYPSGNEDMVYFIYTFYNVTSTTPGIYANVRPGMRELLEQKAVEFQQRNNTSFGVTLPTAGYTIVDMFANFAADMDVGNAGVNYASVNVAFDLGYTYEHTFSRFVGWTFDPSIFSAPFFAGTGFIGVKYLKSPEISPGVEAGLTLFSNTSNGGDFSDPSNTTQLFRYVSGNISPAAGDDPCNFNPLATNICFINGTEPDDMRFFQSSGPLTLAPGEFGSIVVAYIFAAPVATGSCPGPACDITPGNPTIIAGLNDPAVVANGVNPVDSISGFLSANDENLDGILTQDEYTVVPGSMLGKALVAQTIFDNKFLLPFSPEPPEFFLVPGDNQVTVLWRPSTSETLGDPFFAIASQPQVDGNPNPLYDPNYRQFDVEGYRVYRGRVDAPNSLTLLAQFDYAGTVISDFAGQVNPNVLCAPELGINLPDGEGDPGCPVDFDPVVPGQARLVSNDVPLVGEIVQVKLFERTTLATGEAILLISDTAVTGNEAGFPELSDTGIPFVYVDNTPRNNFRYFYSVTAFDINSFQSGPTNLESPRATKPATPVRLAANYENTAVLDVGVFGRNGRVPDIAVPSLDPATGTFSGPFPSLNGASLSLVAFVQQLIAAPGAVAARLDSLDMGSAYDEIPQTYYVTLTTASGSTELAIPITQDIFDVTNSVDQTFVATNVDASLASRYGGNGSYELSGNLHIELPGNYYTNSFGRGCVNGAPGFGDDCDYNGARWFDGPSPANNETFAHPTQGNAQNGGGNATSNFTNAGSLTGVANVHETRSYQTAVNIYRDVEGGLGAAVRAADFNMYWGAGGLVDSVIDVSNDIVVPFNGSEMNASWGFLNPGDAAGAGSFDGRAELTTTDFSCIEPLRSFSTAQGRLPCATAAPYALSQTAVPGPIAFWTTSLGNAATSPAAANPGFGIYLSGHMFLVELEAGAGVPAAGTVWTMRSYTGVINGGGCSDPAVCIAGNDGPYQFVEQVVRPFSAVGAEVRFTYDVVNQLNAPVDADLSDVHTVPDPYYVTNEFEQSTDTKIIKFVNLPQDAVIRIYSSSGVLVDLLEHHTTTFGGEETWDVRNRNDQVVASGVYFFHVEAGNARRVGRFTIVNFAQ